jgi:hypothetical protein
LKLSRSHTPDKGIVQEADPWLKAMIVQRAWHAISMKDKYLGACSPP